MASATGVRDLSAGGRNQGRRNMPDLTCGRFNHFWTGSAVGVVGAGVMAARLRTPHWKAESQGLFASQRHSPYTLECTLSNDSHAQRLN
eukprot:2738795-Amphidinium_carterae.1